MSPRKELNSFLEPFKTDCIPRDSYVF